MGRNSVAYGKPLSNILNENVFGFELFDSVIYRHKGYFVFGKRKTGYLDIRDLFGNKVNNGSISYKKT